MKQQLQAIVAEIEKIRHSKIVWVTFIAFSLGPIMGGLIMIILDNPDTFGQSGMLSNKAQMMSFEIDWNSYLSILSQVVGVGGVLIFGFVASWIFGREYSDGIAKDLLALPTNRYKILNSKFAVYFLWCMALTISNFLLGLIIGNSIYLTGFSYEVILSNLKTYFSTSILVISIGTPISFFALWGKGYMAPIGFVALTLVFSQIIGALGVGHYFPWALPGLFSGAGGIYKASINYWSYLILIITSISGYIASQIWWKNPDQY
jgi:ABC-type transport system involved in multi-copper enzyme maturation permease subunit